MRTIASVVTAAAILGGVMAQMHAQSMGVVQAPKDAKWGPAPPMLPPGAEIALVAGDPGKSAPYTVRLKFPAHYAIPAHSHPTDENVAVVSGALTLGMGDKLDKQAKGNATLAAGSYALAPSGMNHYAFTGAQETVILLYGIGPVEFKYVNAQDDPRNTKATK